MLIKLVDIRFKRIVSKKEKDQSARAVRRFNKDQNERRELVRPRASNFDAPLRDREFS